MFSSASAFVPTDVHTLFPDQPIESQSESDDQSELCIFDHILTNGEAVCERYSSHRSLQCSSQPATSKLACLLTEKYGWNDDTSQRVGLLFNEGYLRHSLFYKTVFILLLTYLNISPALSSLPTLCLQTCN